MGKGEGVGSQFRRKYYFALTVIYLAVAILPIALLGQTADCPVVCALRFPDRPWKNWECTENIGEPVGDYAAESEYKRIYLQFYKNTTGPCFVCQKANLTVLLEPCKPCPAAQMVEEGLPWESTDERYSKLSSCAEPGSISECSGAEVTNYRVADQTAAQDKYCLEDTTCLAFGADEDPMATRTKFAPEMDITLRGMVPMLMLLISAIYFGQAIGCLATALCLTRFLE